MVYIICHRNRAIIWLRKFNARNEAEDYIEKTKYRLDYVGKSLILSEELPEAIFKITQEDILTKEDLEEIAAQITRNTYNQRYYDISEKDNMEISDIDDQILIFKTENGKYIKGIVFRDIIYTDDATEYDTLEECEKGGETRELETWKLTIEGGVVYIENRLLT